MQCQLLIEYFFFFKTKKNKKKNKIETEHNK
jgi:hypothetical protein